MKYTILVLSLALAGCSEDRFRTTTDVICLPEVTEKVASFSQQCTGGGNPMSDEEPEDWIGKCLDMAQEIYCESVIVRVDQKRFGLDRWQEVGRSVMHKKNGQPTE